MTNAVRLPLGTAIAVLGLALLLWVGNTFTATAKGEPTLEGENVVTYDHAEALPFATRELLQGSAVTDGCSFDIAGEVAQDFRGTIITREVAYDPATCQSLIEKVVIPATEVLPGDVLAYNSGTKFGQWTGHWRDPANINVNWNRSKLRWSYDNNQVTLVYHKSCPMYRLKWTGWNVIYDSGCDYGYVGSGTAAYQVESSRTFNNRTFSCVPPQSPIEVRGATTRIHDHRFVGMRGGLYSYSTNMSKFGPCSFLLYSETRLVVD